MDIYLDIDGVILANDYNAADYAHDFLEYVTSLPNATCYWLTTHCHGDAQQAIDRLALVLPPETMELCKGIRATENDWDIAKTEAINFDRPFLWFDDDLYEEEQRDLEAHGALANWVEVDLSRDPGKLRKLITMLQNL